MANEYISPTDQMFTDLGLVDPSTGKLTFDPTGGTGRISDEEVDDLTLIDPNKGLDVEEIQQRLADPKTAQPSSTPQPKAVNWESESNPYKTKYDEVASQMPSPADVAKARYNQSVNRLTAQASEAYNILSSQRDANGQPVFEPNMLASQIKTAHENFVLQERVALERTLTQPIAQRAVAEDIVRKVGGNVSVDDIISLPSPDAMEAVARTLSTRNAGSQPQASERDQRFQARRESGVDTVESGAPLSRSIAESVTKLNPVNKIAYSLRYQQQN